MSHIYHFDSFNVKVSIANTLLLHAVFFFFIIHKKKEKTVAFYGASNRFSFNKKSISQFFCECDLSHFHSEPHI